jgi:hypothetical protein
MQKTYNNKYNLRAALDSNNAVRAAVTYDLHYHDAMQQYIRQ